MQHHNQASSHTVLPKSPSNSERANSPNFQILCYQLQLFCIALEQIQLQRTCEVANFMTIYMPESSHLPDDHSAKAAFGTLHPSNPIGGHSVDFAYIKLSKLIDSKHRD